MKKVPSASAERPHQTHTADYGNLKPHPENFNQSKRRAGNWEPKILKEMSLRTTWLTGDLRKERIVWKQNEKIFGSASAQNRCFLNSKNMEIPKKTSSKKKNDIFLGKFGPGLLQSRLNNGKVKLFQRYFKRSLLW